MADIQKNVNPHFLLVGNGSYQNRGCEAIVRGTMEILRREFGQDIQAKAGVYAAADIVHRQNQAETDTAVSSFSLDGMGPRWSRIWWAMQANKRLGTSFVAQNKPLAEGLSGACVALELGGDNYSLDYGRPESFMAMDRYLQKKGIPVILWGASVGPFDADPEFASRMFDHLKTLTAIFVRETESLEYLRANGVSENVHLVADPAFVMKPVQPAAEKIGFALPEGAIGINLSPLVARYRSPQAPQFDLAEWLAFRVGLVKSTAALKRPIWLIPHVESESPKNDDFNFLQSLCKIMANEVTVPVQVLSRGLNAAELKWIIIRCSVFAGARTHSTIAALSSCVPTLSIGYSLKARGINRDIFGNLDYCIPVSDLNAGNFIERLNVLLAGEDTIRAQLKARIPEIQAKAFSAGPLLRKLIR